MRFRRLILPLVLLRDALTWMARSPLQAFVVIFAVSFAIRGALLFSGLLPLHPEPVHETGHVALSLARSGRFADPYEIPTGLTAHPITRGDRRWLIRVYLGRDHETKKRNYHNRTIHGPMRGAQAYLTRKLRERDLGRDLVGAKITLNEYLDRWIQTAVKPRVRGKRRAKTTKACCGATSDPI